MTYRNLEHMTDAFIEVSGQTLEEAFETAGIAVVDTILDVKSIGKRMIEISKLVLLILMVYFTTGWKR